MDTARIESALSRLFHEEGERIVFWNDSEQEFAFALSTIQLEGVNVLRLDQAGALAVKIQVEQTDPTGKYLIYTPAEEPEYEKDWLLDMRLYARSFRADRASILLDQLGLVNQSLRQHIADRRKFFDSKERLRRLQPLVEPSDTEADLDLKMIAVLVRAEQPELLNVLQTVFHAFAESPEEIDLDTEPAVWDQVVRFDLDEPFWRMVKATFGYDEDDPSLRNLLIRLMLTDIAQAIKGEFPPALQSLTLPAAGRSNAIVFLAQWRDSSSRAGSYDHLSEAVAAMVNLEPHVTSARLEDLVDVMTFQVVERKIASALRERVESTVETIHADSIKAIADRRRAGHWVSSSASGAPETPREAFHAVYDALVAAADFFSLRNEHRDGFDYADAASMYHAYEQELYRFDQLYRHFCEAADQAEAAGWNILKSLRGTVEACYVNWFLPKLGLAWGKFFEVGGGPSLLEVWRIDDEVKSQQQFYDRHVLPRLKEAENRRAFVIVSDAFRYEAAQELVRELNGKYRFGAGLSSQLGVLPSYTALGMASLLPHQTLSYKASGEVLVDGKPAASLDQRNGILQSAGGIACRAEELTAKKKEEGREFIGDRRVVYIYHNTVDAVGEASEAKTFEAVRKAINELGDLVKYVLNNLNGTQVIVTADHGFLFTESAPGEPEKSKLDQKPDGTVKAKKRYLIGQKLGGHESVWHGSTATTASAGGEMEFWVPRGANRFHFMGASRFVHGGAMLQEVVVPVITVKLVKGSKVGQTKSKPVTVHVLGAHHKITTNQYRFELIQMEPVSDRVRPITLKVAVYERDEPVTNIESLTFDSGSDKMDDRKKWVRLVLQDRKYDKKTEYRLILRDAETGIEQQSMAVTIDRAFTDDF